MVANLYVHFPFCRSRCSYCSLYSRARSTATERERYIESIRVELESLRVRLASTQPDSTRPYSTLNDPNPTLKTLYFGGGSPALCDLTPLRDALTPLLDENTEFTVELHPLDVTPAKLDELKSIGVNRISMGVQSLDDDILCAMGRGYTASDAARAFALVKSRFDNAGIDLIIGYPGDSIKWLDSLRDWGLTHCSAYSLQNERGLKDVPDDDIVLDRIRTVAAFLKTLGLERYEISNYARPGFECRHNFAVWHGEDYIGLGEGACGREGLKRTRGILQNSVNGDREEGKGKREEGRGKSGENLLIAYKTTEVSPLEDLKERTLFRLRTRDGIDSSRFPEWRPTLDRFVTEGLLVKIGESVYRLTERGTEVCDAILEELV